MRVGRGVWILMENKRSVVGGKTQNLKPRQTHRIPRILSLSHLIRFDIPLSHYNLFSTH